VGGGGGWVCVVWGGVLSSQGRGGFLDVAQGFQGFKVEHHRRGGLLGGEKRGSIL